MRMIQGKDKNSSVKGRASDDYEGSGFKGGVRHTYSANPTGTAHLTAVSLPSFATILQFSSPASSSTIVLQMVVLRHSAQSMGSSAWC